MPRVYLSPPEIRPDDHRALESVLASNWVAPVGPDLGRFEAALCERTGRRAAVAVSSGTAALHLALQVLGVGPGDTVLCPSLTFAASANPVCYCGAEPVFVDSEPETWNIDPDLLAEALEALSAEGRRPRALILVQIYGQCAKMEPILELCERFGLPLIEDAAEALGASYRGRPAGSFGRMSFFSFNGNKIITTSGGGMLLSDDAEAIDAARYLTTACGEPCHTRHGTPAYNYRSCMQFLAALGLSTTLAISDSADRVASLIPSLPGSPRRLTSAGLHADRLRGRNAINYCSAPDVLFDPLCGSRSDDMIVTRRGADIEAQPCDSLQPCSRSFRIAGSSGASRGGPVSRKGSCLRRSSLREYIRDRMRTYDPALVHRLPES